MKPISTSYSEKMPAPGTSRGVLVELGECQLHETPRSVLVELGKYQLQELLVLGLMISGNASSRNPHCVLVELG